MDSQRFDALTSRLGGAGSRRHVLSALVASAVAQVFPGSDADEAAAACKGFNAKCKSQAGCCADDGYRCVKVGKGGKKKKRRTRRCRCKSGTCPPETPCCIRGKCEELCDGECCADCFVLITGHGVPPAPNSDECCPQDKICGPNPKQLSDDRCCFPNEDCVNGHCCTNDGSLGSVVCGGKCCSEAACCNGECCDDGKVCASTPQGIACVSDSRGCSVPGDCFPGEICHGGVCCSGERVCSVGLGADVCCAADERCELPDTQFAVCCKINTTCNSFKGHRVRR